MESQRDVSKQYQCPRRQLIVKGVYSYKLRLVRFVVSSLIARTPKGKDPSEFYLKRDDTKIYNLQYNMYKIVEFLQLKIVLSSHQ